ncbi:MAG TPA: outer membrane beta-barrel protein [Blastocatellia bacterium]|nr:outer membrane beta-barrel protein [Blastocatellia bacterium]
MGLIFLPDVSLSGSRNDGRSLCSLPLERLLQLMLKGRGMPNYRSAVTLCVLLLLTLFLYEPVNAQSETPKIEVGVLISGLARGRFGDPESLGGGGRVTFNLTKALALEGELNYFPSTGSNDVRRLQGQFGVKSGWRFKKFGVFGKVRPGFIDTKRDFQPSCFFQTICPPNQVCAPIFPPFCSSFTFADRGFSLDVGGVAELYPSKRIVVRLDVGDTIADRQSAPIFISQPIFNSQGLLLNNTFFTLPGGNVTTHNLQLSVGVGFRF